MATVIVWSQATESEMGRCPLLLASPRKIRNRLVEAVRREITRTDNNDGRLYHRKRHSEILQRLTTYAEQLAEYCDQYDGMPPPLLTPHSRTALT